MAKLSKFNSALFSFFNPNKNAKFDALEEDTTPTLKYFFKSLGRKFWKLVTLNLMMLPMVLPILIAIYVYLSLQKTPAANSLLFIPLFGAQTAESSTANIILLDLFGAQYMIPAYNNTASYVAIGALALVLAVTFGWQNVGATYILRSMVRGEPVFLLSDYFYGIKKNLKEGFWFGLFDFAVISLLCFDFIYFWGAAGSGALVNFMFYVICAIGILYFFMRFYLYLMLITFNLSFRKLLKNALIFTTLGVKRNLMAALGMILLAALNILLLAWLAPYNIAIPVILPLFYFLSFTAFMASYAAYPIIDRYMIAPYQKKEETTEESSTDAE